MTTNILYCKHREGRSRMTTLSNYKVHTKHDEGTITIIATSITEDSCNGAREQAIQQVMSTEKCPRSSIIATELVNRRVFK